MKVIKFFFYLILSLAVLIFLVMPPLVGLYIKHQYYATIDQANKQNPNLVMKVNHYKMGWFSAKFSTEIDFSTNNDSLRIAINGSVKHGPIIVTKNQGHSRYNIALAEINGNIPVINLTSQSLWQFNNTITSQFSSPGFNLDHKSAAVKAKGIQGNSHYSLSSQKLQVLATLDSLQILTANQMQNSVNKTPILTISNVKYSADLQRQGLINYGPQHVSIGKIDIQTQHDTISLNNMTFSSNVTANNGKTNMSLQYAIPTITKNPAGIKSIQFSLALKDIDTKSFNELLQSMSDQSPQQTPNVRALIAPGMKVLRNGFTIELNHLLIDTDHGVASLKGKFQIPTLPKNATMLQIPMAAMADFKFQAPKAWLKQQVASVLGAFQPHHSGQRPADPNELAALSLQQWENQNLIISAGDDYVSHLQFKRGQLLINGKVPDLNKKPTPVKPQQNRQNDQNLLNYPHGQPRMGDQP